ncbi:hypothetical protein [Pantoea ananatis]|uniref:hypothetical protein n=1 Tax=Pantoea ananas TaxID=553 RepID=UPI001B30CBC6|nr:hypothetical protein [Pantoea ananatis]
MTIKWWEKTVEYAFIMQAVLDNKLVSPLSGLHEKAGDAVFRDENKWILIEFKRNFSSITDEKSKFEDYKLAEQKLIEKDSHHFLIYGKIVKDKEVKEEKIASDLKDDIKKEDSVKKNSKENVILAYETYFSRTPANSIEEMLKNKTDLILFKEYLDEFIGFKKDKTETTGDAALNFEDYTAVACVNKDGLIETLMKPGDFQNELELNYIIERKLIKRAWKKNERGRRAKKNNSRKTKKT